MNRNSEIEAIAFDFVGVLGGEIPIAMTPLEHTIETYFGKINFNEEFCQTLSVLTGESEGEIAQVSKRLIERLYKLREPHLFDKVPKLTFALASNHLAWFYDWFKTLPISHNFGYFFNPTEMGSAKPNPAYYTAIFRKLNISPEKILFIDDSPLNIEAAKACGMQTILYQGRRSLSDTILAFMTENKALKSRIR